MSRPDTREAAGLGLTHAAKRIVAEGPLLLGVNADVGEQFIA
ncbi:hypothetical protein [Xanthomonas sp. LMG 12459]|nr:hypothetical protein [Xanthomonas sp. LMG 12459]